MGDTILRVDDIQKFYGNKGNLTKAIDHISFSVRKGEFLGIMGASGSGKTTLLNCISTIDTVTSGHIYVEEKDITALHGAQLADFRGKKLGFIFQDFNLLDTLTAFENIALALPIIKTPVSQIEPMVLDVAQKLEITEVLRKYPYQMSGGQKQRVAVAGIIAMKPMCIVLDEPTAMLDPSGRHEVMNTVKKLNKEEGITIVLITHYMDEAVQADRVVVMDDGQIKLDDTPRNVFAKVDEIKALGLDVPQSTELVYRLGIKCENTVLNANECVDLFKKTLEAKR